MDSDLAGRIERQRCLAAALRETLADIDEGIAATGEKLADTLSR
jgi:predicted transcriptional regulator